ncbi:hypothetical protein BUALT_Bualt13G0100000 [Buddleja alternifolia]|uniref:Methyltransferase-related protein n=1 Tax=Buddleja alternifolia TaxID=168488 RepID=A0AAV6WUN3_9LAMI|nr:hypothetical protein BUALT_Bualt13G0100000 [Buddleja alternifolia]
MCPLRMILIFISATLAAFFAFRNLKSPTGPQNDVVSEEFESKNAVPLSFKASAAIGKGFSTFVDMASGRYLWRNLVSSAVKCHTQ